MTVIDHLNEPVYLHPDAPQGTHSRPGKPHPPHNTSHTLAPFIGSTKKLLHYEMLKLKLEQEEPKQHIVVEPEQKMELKVKQEKELERKEQYYWRERQYWHKQLEAGSSVKKLSLEEKSFFPSSFEVPYIKPN